MQETLISIVIPYYRRLHNFTQILRSLERQTMPADRFEVVVGSMEYSCDYVSVCARFSEKIRIRTVMTSEPWQVGLARNIAIRQASGNTVLLLDSDMILPAGFLENLHNRHFADGQEHCVIGQMLDYDNNNTDVVKTEERQFSYYLDLLEEQEKKGDFIYDERWKVRCSVPWAFAWTALIALPRRTLEKHRLYFDLNFFGYGVEDLEWAYRINRSGTELKLAADVWGIHVPHARNVNANRETEKRNYRYFLEKWPGYDVEIVSALGDFNGNLEYPAYLESLESAAAGGGDFCVACTRSNTAGKLIIGLQKTPDGKPVNLPAGTADKDLTVLPLAGIDLPFADGSMDEVVILDPVNRIPDRYREMILAEANRLSDNIILQHNKTEGHVI
ncbi:MAG: glycosyltransferase family 2 protein [Spirochaetales bacterium]|nr:glycosyltransferase family 2 protein [Spirochaetales bacterium]